MNNNENQLEKIEKDIRNEKLRRFANDILEVLNENERLKEIEKEHQKQMGEIEAQLTYYESIVNGRTIQEMGLSDLYKED